MEKDSPVLRGSLIDRHNAPVLRGSLIDRHRSKETPRLRGKGLAIGRKAVGESCDVSKIEVCSESTAYNNPHYFEHNELSTIETVETSDAIVHIFPNLGVMALLKFEGYGDTNVLQVDVAEIVDGMKGQGYGTDIYRYAMSHLPSGYTGILSGTITNEAIPRIYESLGAEPDFTLTRMGNPIKPAMYLLKKNIEDN